VLDHSFNAQTTDNEFVTVYRKAVSWMTKVSAFSLFHNPLRPLMQWYLRREMDKYIIKVIKDRYASGQSSSTSKRGKPAIDLALDEYRARQQEGTGAKMRNEPDATFMKFVADQLKTFIVAGHETTSSASSYIYYLLSLNPEKLVKLRDELDQVLGPAEGTPDLVKSQPHLLNQLPYTAAVIKETLRMFPLATGIRSGAGPITLDGREYPTKGLSVWICNYALMHRADLFPSPDEFIPERFLPAPDNWQEVHKDAYRPFERGPRSCFGQELAMLELKLIIAMTVRNFDMVDAYKEWDTRLGRAKPGETLGGKRGAFGYRGYMVQTVGGYPSDGMPVKVQKRT